MYTKKDIPEVKKALLELGVDYRKINLVWENRDPLDPTSKVDFIALTPEGEEMINDKIMDMTEKEMMELDQNLYYADMRLNYLYYQNPQLMRELFVERELIDHLIEIHQRVVDFIDLEKPKMMESWGLTEEMKLKEPNEYNGLMNNLTSSLREIAIKEIVES